MPTGYYVIKPEIQEVYFRLHINTINIRLTSHIAFIHNLGLLPLGPINKFQSQIISFQFNKDQWVEFNGLGSIRTQEILSCLYSFTSIQTKDYKRLLLNVCKRDCIVIVVNKKMHTSWEIALKYWVMDIIFCALPLDMPFNNKSTLAMLELCCFGNQKYFVVTYTMRGRKKYVPSNVIRELQ